MKILKFAISPLLALTGALGGGSKKPAVQPAPLPTATRDDAQAQAARQQELLRRRGGAADIVAGTGGLDAAGGKTTLGS